MASSKNGQFPEVKSELNNADSATQNPLRRRRKILKPGLTATKKERYFVEHSYNDHANDEETDFAAGTFDAIAKTPLHAKNLGQSSFAKKAAPLLKSGPALSFPFKLHNMMDNAHADGFDHIVSWQSHGRCFMIRDMNEFVSKALPRYFKLNKITSFQRQLNLYGFRRLTQGADAGAYYHELFLRGKLFLCHKIQRMKNKGVGYKAASSPDSEPNFYLMKALPDIPLYLRSAEEAKPQLIDPRKKEGPEKNSEREYLAKLVSTSQLDNEEAGLGARAPLDSVSFARRGAAVALERSMSALSLPDMNPNLSFCSHTSKNVNQTSQSAPPAPRNLTSLKEHGLMIFSAFSNKGETMQAIGESLPSLPFAKKVQDVSHGSDNSHPQVVNFGSYYSKASLDHRNRFVAEASSSSNNSLLTRDKRSSKRRQDTAIMNGEQVYAGTANELALNRFADERIKASDFIIDPATHGFGPHSSITSANASPNLGGSPKGFERRKSSSSTQGRKRGRPSQDALSSYKSDTEMLRETDPIVSFVWDPKVEEALEVNDSESHNLQVIGDPNTTTLKSLSENQHSSNLKTDHEKLEKIDEDANELDILVKSMLMD